jgi:nucleotide-binding universal stress UspA family protein
MERVTDQMGTNRDELGDKVVVGVDGSDSSLAALRWAVRQAVWTGLAVEVVTAWNFPEHPAPLGVEIKVPWPDELLAQAREKLDQIVSEVLSEDERRLVRTKVVRGGAAQVLLEEAHGAALLVVGSRGRSAFQELLLGSVSERCVRHAECPVVVVR